MVDHPVRLRLDDDLRRSRLTVFFRLLLVIPHLVWFGLWTIGVVFASLAQWIVVVARGRPAEKLYDFLAAYVGYEAQLAAYVYLVTNPYPEFTGASGYDLDLEIDDLRPQGRLGAAFRFFLALPALLLAFALAGTTIRGGYYSLYVIGGSALGAVGFLGWFESLVRGRMSQGMRDLGVYAIGYNAQATAYLLLLTDRYPTSDPRAYPAAHAPELPATVSVQEGLRRSRLTVFFRGLLTIPHQVWLLLWAVAVLAATIVNWFALWIRGRPLEPIHRFVARFVRYQAHVGAFFYLIANPFPGFTGEPGSYPLEAELPAPGRQSRPKAFFRVLLAVPAFLLAGAVANALLAASVLAWFYALATARMPEGLRNLGAYAIGYTTQVAAYTLLLTDRYPYSGPPGHRPAPVLEAEPEPQPEPA